MNTYIIRYIHYLIKNITNIFLNFINLYFNYINPIISCYPCDFPTPPTASPTCSTLPSPSPLSGNSLTPL